MVILSELYKFNSISMDLCGKLSNWKVKKAYSCSMKQWNLYIKIYTQLKEVKEKSVFFSVFIRSVPWFFFVTIADVTKKRRMKKKLLWFLMKK